MVLKNQAAEVSFIIKKAGFFTNGLARLICTAINSALARYWPIEGDGIQIKYTDQGFIVSLSDSALAALSMSSSVAVDNSGSSGDGGDGGNTGGGTGGTVSGSYAAWAPIISGSGTDWSATFAAGVVASGATVLTVQAPPISVSDDGFVYCCLTLDADTGALVSATAAFATSAPAGNATTVYIPVSQITTSAGEPVGAALVGSFYFYRFAGINYLTPLS